MKQTITFQFSDFQLLCAFAEALKFKDYKIDGLRLVCRCDEDMISEAITFYGARIIQHPIQAE